MVICWDPKADTVVEGDQQRDIRPIYDKTYTDENGFVHYAFSKLLFKNPKYKIPTDKKTLFKKFLDGGSRSYPSDGNIPLDIVATETRVIIHKIVGIAGDPESPYYEMARDALKNGKYGIIRGVVKLYLKKYTTRDWRRKRFTDGIDFWIFKLELFENVLKNSGWEKNKNTKEWQKKVAWTDYNSGIRETGILTASNDLFQLMDFGSFDYLENASLKAIFKKKLTRGHDVDLSDVINVAMVQYTFNKDPSEDMLEAWSAIEEVANTREGRIISNLISLCRYSYGVAEYIENVRNSIIAYENWILDPKIYPDPKLRRLCRYSAHWMGYYINNGPDATRTLIYSYLIDQQNKKRLHIHNLTAFADGVQILINSKLMHIKTIIEIEN